MATVTKDFKVKNGLIVEGTTGTIDGQDILTKKQDDRDYIVGLIGGTATANNTADTVVKRDGSGNFAAGVITADLTGDVTGNADTATALETARTIELTGDITGSVSFDGTANVQISTTLDGDFATDAEVATAKDEAIDAAEAYTDGRETAITAAYQAYADQAEADAISTASADATSKANAALASANSYTDDEISDLDLSLKAYADQAEADAISTAAADATSKANTAESNANSYTDGEISDLDTTLRAYADTAEADAITSANSYTDGRETAITTAYQAYADQAEVDAKAYTDTAIGNLVDGAPALLDTLNELAAAIADDENFATTVTNSLALKADITYVDDEISDLNTSLQAYADQAEVDAKAYTDTRESAITSAYQAYADQAEADAISTASADATNKADAAEADANSYTDGKITQEVADRNSAISSAVSDEVTNRNTAINAAIAQEVIDRNSAITTAVDAIDTDDIEEGTGNLYFTNQRAIDAVGGTIGDAIDELTTDDIEEGVNNLYYTTSRAKGDAAALLTGASLTNIQITGDENGLTITAENGVADSDTDDLAEGSTNLYFTDARAVSALEAVVPNFEAVEIDSLAKQVAATVSVPTASTVTGFSWAAADYRTAKFLVKTAYGTHTDVAEVLLTLDTSDNIAITEYAMVGTNGSAMTISADVSGTDVRLRVATVNNNSTVTVVGTLLA
jgi:hypothetical protein